MDKVQKHNSFNSKLGRSAYSLVTVL